MTWRVSSNLLNVSKPSSPINSMLSQNASGSGAVVAAWTGLILALGAWLGTAYSVKGEVTIKSLGSNEAMLAGNLVAILSSGLIHLVWSITIDPQVRIIAGKLAICL